MESEAVLAESFWACVNNGTGSWRMFALGCVETPLLALRFMVVTVSLGVSTVHTSRREVFAMSMTSIPWRGPLRQYSLSFARVTVGMARAGDVDVVLDVAPRGLVRIPIQWRIVKAMSRETQG